MGIPEQKCVHQNVAGAYSVLQSFVHVFSLHFKNEKKTVSASFNAVHATKINNYVHVYKALNVSCFNTETSHHYPCVKTVHSPYLYGERECYGMRVLGRFSCGKVSITL